MGRINTLETQVLAVLAKDEASRNSDIRLTKVLWYTYHRSHFKEIDGKWYVGVDSLNVLPREDNIKRVRAKIQNEKHLFLPTDPAVAEKRNWNMDAWREYLGYPTGDPL